MFHNQVIVKTIMRRRHCTFVIFVRLDFRRPLVIEPTFSCPPVHQYNDHKTKEQNLKMI